MIQNKNSKIRTFNKYFYSNWLVSLILEAGLADIEKIPSSPRESI